VAVFGSDRQHCFTDDTFPTDVEVRDVVAVEVPPLYRGSKRSHADDIALLLLERAVAVAPGVAPLCYEPDGPDDDLLDGDAGLVAGWNLAPKQCDSPHRWKAHSMEYIPHSSCLSQISDAVLTFADTRKFCARVIDGTYRTLELELTIFMR